MKRVLILLLILTLGAAALSGCAAKEIRADDIKFIEVRAGSFKADYSVDEKIDFTNTYIVINLKENKGEIVERFSEDMLDGFDTSTTTAPMEMRSMRVKYKGLYTSNWNYTVSSPYDIDTKARLKAATERSDGKLTLLVSVALDILPKISALQFEVVFDSARLSYSNEITQLPAGWDSEKRSTRAGSLELVLYAGINAQPITKDGVAAALSFDITAEGVTHIQIKSITISFGEKDIFLPDIAAK